MNRSQKSGARSQEMRQLEIMEKDHMDHMKNRGREHGFTLMELLIVILMMGVVMAGIYAVYASQQKSFIVQEGVAEMQQNLRAAMFFLVRDIRLAGCNPTGKADAGIKVADVNTISLTMDVRGKNPDDPPDGDTGDPEESVTYALMDSDGDGTADSLGRDTGSGLVAVASNIDALNFVYLDANGNVLVSPLSTADLAKVRTVQLTVVARTEAPSGGYRDKASYKNLQGTVILPPQNDGFRRRIFATNIRCRNLGLL
jgi:type IV pilus assembly protein PilW